METIEQRKIKEIENNLIFCKTHRNKEIKANQYNLVFGGTCWGFDGFYITDKISKYAEVFPEFETAKSVLIARYGKPTRAEKIAEIMAYLTANNLNYTKQQYNYIMELSKLLGGGQNGVEL